LACWLYSKGVRGSPTTARRAARQLLTEIGLIFPRQLTANGLLKYPPHGALQYPPHGALRGYLGEELLRRIGLDFGAQRLRTRSMLCQRESKQHTRFNERRTAIDQPALGLYQDESETGESVCQETRHTFISRITLLCAIRRSASEQRGDDLNRLEDCCLQVKARNWP